MAARRAIGLAAAAALLAGQALATSSHGLSAFGDLKYPANFDHFDWVDPDALKGGSLSHVGTAAIAGFDSLNGYILKGDPVQGTWLVFDSLMVRSGDEPDAVYGLVAESADVADDGRSVSFRLRPEARFHDGSPLTAEDVVFSFNVLKKDGHPAYASALRDVAKAEILSDREVRFVFEGEDFRDLPMEVATLPIFSMAYYADRDFARSTLDPPLGSGPYRFGDFKPGQYMVYERVEDYWARDLPVNRGRYNFDRIRYEYFRDREASFEAFKAGQYDLRQEFTSRIWATRYDFPAVKAGYVKREVLPDDTPSCTQGWWINTRRAKFHDIRVRQALDLAFDYEWTNKTIFYGAYTRTASFFENSPLAAAGLPGPDELAIMEPLRDHLDPGVFGPAYVPPMTDGGGANRANLRAAAELLEEAGWTAGTDGIRRNAAGDRLEVEFLTNDTVFQTVLGPYVEALARVGIDARVRQVDDAQFQRRLETFDFDLRGARFVLGSTPGPSLRNFFGSETADREGGYNLSGIKDPVIDTLIDRIVSATDRKEMTAATRVLDRVLRAGHYWIPNWCGGSHRVAYWDKFNRPGLSPTYYRGDPDTRGILDTWWVDPTKDAAINAARGR